ALKLAGVQKRVETMLTMTGAQDVLEIHPDAPSAIRSFGV
ncbi:MAG: spoIIAA, partial [Acidobacteria bacterium]|nr:spoIIAA [Acidobacteriota bacterium]